MKGRLIFVITIAAQIMKFGLVLRFFLHLLLPLAVINYIALSLLYFIVPSPGLKLLSLYLASVSIIGMIVTKEYLLRVGLLKKKSVGRRVEKGVPKQYAQVAKKLMKIPWLLGNIVALIEEEEKDMSDSTVCKSCKSQELSRLQKAIIEDSDWLQNKQESSTKKEQCDEYKYTKILQANDLYK